LREAGVTRRDKTYLWGHSAGGQFVHRLLATQPHGIFEAVGAANSGWYTLPTLDLLYPDGLGGIGLTREDAVRLLGYPLVIFSGDQDIEGTAENFPRHEAAMAQGQTGLRGRSSTSPAGRRKPQLSACPAAGVGSSCRASRMRGCGCPPSPPIIGLVVSGANSAPRASRGRRPEPGFAVKVAKVVDPILGRGGILKPTSGEVHQFAAASCAKAR
jgi:hypothetical protein